MSTSRVADSCGSDLGNPSYSPFRIGTIRAEPERGILTFPDEEKRLGCRPMALLEVLSSRPGELVSKQSLIDLVWGGQAVSDDSLSVAVYQLRKALGDDARSPIYLETIPGRGYRWIADGRWVAAPRSRQPPSADGAPPAESLRRPGFSSPGPQPPDSLAVDSAPVDSMRGSLSGMDPKGPDSSHFPSSAPSPQHGPEASGFPDSPMQAPADVEPGEDSQVEVDGSAVISLKATEAASPSRPFSAIPPLAWLAVFLLSVAAAGMLFRADGSKPAHQAEAPMSLDALDAYIEGRRAYNRGSPDDYRAAIRLMRQAIALEPDMAEAHAILSLSASMLWSGEPEAQALKQLAETAMERALALNPELPEAHLARAETIFLTSHPDLDAARRALEEALRLSPSFSEAASGLTWLSLVRGDFEATEAWVERSLKINPLLVLPYRFQYRLRAYRGELEQAKRALEEIEQRFGSSYALRLRWDLCLRWPAEDQIWSCIRSLQGLDGAAGPPGSDRWDEIPRLIPAGSPIRSQVVAKAAFLLRLENDREAALTLLEGAVDQRDWNLFEIGVDPLFAPLRGDPRFESLLSALDLTPS